MFFNEFILVFAFKGYKNINQTCAAIRFIVGLCWAECRWMLYILL